MHASKKSLRGLDIVNIFMADVKDGVGVYLSVYLLTKHHWDPSKIGIAVAIPWFIAILVQSPVGDFIDKTKHKRMLLIAASALVAVSCIMVVVFPQFIPIIASQVLLGFVQTIFPPCVAAISLGMVGHRMLSKRIGRNESFNHGGNMLAAVVAVFIGWFISYEGIFYFSILQCLLIIIATMMIQEKDIDHDLARAGHGDKKHTSYLSEVKGLFSDKRIVHFTLSMCLWNIANGTMLPLLGQKLGVTSPANSALYLSICIIIAQTVMTFVAPLAAKHAENGRKLIFLIAFLFVPLRAILFALMANKYLLISFQIIDGLGAGIYGVLSILMMADLSKGTSHFSLLQGTVYTSIGLGVTVSSVAAGFIVKYFGYSAAFLFLAAIGVVATLHFWFFVRETAIPTRYKKVNSHHAQVPRLGTIA